MPCRSVRARTHAPRGERYFIIVRSRRQLRSGNVPVSVATLFGLVTSADVARAFGYAVGRA